MSLLHESLGALNITLVIDRYQCISLEKVNIIGVLALSMAVEFTKTFNVVSKGQEHDMTMIIHLSNFAACRC